ncbi:hypothetical protein D3C80_907220 [compost metagenome]
MHVIVVGAYAIGAVAGIAGRFMVDLGDDAAGVVGQQQQRVVRRVRALHCQGVRVTQQVLSQQVAFFCSVQAMALVTALHHTGAAVHTRQQLVMAVVQVPELFAAFVVQYAFQTPPHVVFQCVPLLVVEHVAARVVGEGLPGGVVLDQGVGHLGQLEAVVGGIAEACDVFHAIGKPCQAAIEVVQGVEGKGLRADRAVLAVARQCFPAFALRVLVGPVTLVSVSP